MTTIADLPRYYRAGFRYPSKFALVSLIVRVAMERMESRGKGSKADRRLYHLRMRSAYGGPSHLEPSIGDLINMAAVKAERYTEGRTYPPFPSNPHD